MLTCFSWKGLLDGFCRFACDTLPLSLGCYLHCAMNENRCRPCVFDTSWLERTTQGCGIQDDIGTALLDGIADEIAGVTALVVNAPGDTNTLHRPPTRSEAGVSALQRLLDALRAVLASFSRGKRQIRVNRECEKSPTSFLQRVQMSM